MITSGSPNSTGWPSSTRICVTVPARGDGIWFIVFIASMISKVCPAVTFEPTSMKGLAPGSEAQYTVPTLGEGTTPGCWARSTARAGPRQGPPHTDVPRDTYAQARAFNFDLGETGLVEQQRQFTDQRAVVRFD